MNSKNAHSGDRTGSNDGLRRCCHCRCPTGAFVTPFDLPTPVGHAVAALRGVRPPRPHAPRASAVYGSARMRHATPEDLEKIGTLLDEVRRVPGLVERTPGSFYRGPKGFLHFHDDPTGMYADVRLVAGEDFVAAACADQGRATLAARSGSPSRSGGVGREHGPAPHAAHVRTNVVCGLSTTTTSSLVGGRGTVWRGNAVICRPWVERRPLSTHPSTSSTRRASNSSPSGP